MHVPLSNKQLFRKSQCLVFFLSLAIFLAIAQPARAQEGFYDIQPFNLVYTFHYQQSADALVAVNADANTGATFQWQQATTAGGTFTNTGVTTANYTPVLSADAWFRRITTVSGESYYSNVVKYEVVSLYRENINYVREHNILKQGITDWKAVDQLPIGDKLQTTTYLDGLARPLQKVSRETATPATAGGTWGDVVQFSKYDIFGKQPKEYLPYTSLSQPGKYKTSPETDQASYYTGNYNETNPYSEITAYYSDPLNRPKVVKSSGTKWSEGNGNKVEYRLNTTADQVRKFIIGYNAGDIPESPGAYAANTLYKTVYYDENNKIVQEFTNGFGQVVLTKTEIDYAPSGGHAGWICVYSVYDEFGLLRYQLQPEAVKWLDNNGWSFSVSNGPTVLAEQCFRYEYDDKSRTIRKKAPGANELKMVYDNRDRIVFMQDGNQAVQPTPEWTMNLYDELDRIQIVALYKTASPVTTLQANANNAGAVTTISTTIPAQAITNLIVSNRPASNPVPPSTYTAKETIEFVGEFESIGNTDAFEAYIDPGAEKPATTISNTAYSNPVSSSDLNNPAVTTILKYLYYDNYSYNDAKPFNTAFENSQAYPSGGLPITITQRTTDLPTGVKVRVLGTNTFLTSTQYYDEDEQPIQSLEDNIKGGVDITTSQYGWDGRLLSAHTRHSSGGTGYDNFSIITKNIYDKIGRVTSLQKKIGANPFTTIATYEMDDMGRLKTKRLHPDYSGPGAQAGGGLESLAYSYNIHGNITGINKDYALKTPGQYNKWSHYFGMYLGYDNKDEVFNTSLLDGHVTGIMWNTMGDDAQRKYDFTYDNAGRLVKADFRQKEAPTDSWSNTKLDFTVGGNSANGGKITYDLNGNLLNMLQRGVQIGNAAPVTIDDLQYAYQSYSNKLKTVTDNAQAGLGTSNGQWGDFKDGSNGSTDDYVYDENGNLVIDLNKNAKELANVAGANGIRYNFLDKPEEIRIAGKGTIKILYDADATRLQKVFISEGSTSTTKTTTYMGGFVYEEKSNVSVGAKLQYINFEEGRIRVIQPVEESNGYDFLQVAGNLTLPDGKQGVWDYMVRDYQQNVRMILTEEIHWGSNKCTMEDGRIESEKLVFGQQGSSNEVVQTQWSKANIPGQSTGGGWQSNGYGNYVSKLSSSGNKIGPNTLLKVMAGDEISAAVQYYYQNPASNGPGNGTLLNSVVTALVQTLISTSVGSTGLHNGAAGVGSNLQSGPNVGLLSSLTDPNTSTWDDKPKAYLTVLFFDERMQLISENSDSKRVEGSGDGKQPLTLLNLQAPKNGYAYVYVSNESAEPVYFDNLQVADNRGRIVEENHYYAYGLKIAGISSTKLPDDREGHVGNPNLYNDKELFEEGDLEWYDYGYRNYDAQIGRFLQIDPLSDKYYFQSGYVYAINEPIANTDIDGLGPGDVVASKAFEKSVEVVVVGVRKVIDAGNKIISQIVSAGVNLLNTVSNIVNNHVLDPGPKINTIADMALAAKKAKDNPRVQLGDEIIKEIKNDPDYKRIYNNVLNDMKADERFGKEEFGKDYIDKTDKKGWAKYHSLGLGGTKDDEKMWKQALRPWKYKKTQEVGKNPLTWKLRNCTIYPAAHAFNNGRMIVSFYLYDEWDLSAQNGRPKEYNIISKGGGIIWHKLLRMKVLEVRGSWIEFYSYPKVIL